MIKFLTGKGLQPLLSVGSTVEAEFIKTPLPVAEADVTGFLWQTGYLTSRLNNDGTYTFKYPNNEVRSAMDRLNNSVLFRNNSENTESAYMMLEFLGAKNIVELINNFFTRFAKVTHAVYDAIQDARSEELICRMLLALYLRGQNSREDPVVDPEKPGSSGRSDIIARYKGIVYCFELKTAEDAGKSVTGVKEGLERIIKKGYVRGETNTVLIGLAFNKKERNIGGCSFCTGGKEYYIDMEKLKNARDSGIDITGDNSSEFLFYAGDRPPAAKETHPVFA